MDCEITDIDLIAPDGSQREAVQAVSYLPFGPIVSYILGNGQAVTRSYDINYRLTDLTSPAVTLHYVRDANGNITGVTDGSASNTFSYDPLNRLTGVKDATGNLLESYAYTKTGDRTNKTGSGLATGDYGYQANTHWLTRTGNAARAYDKAGNTTGSSQAGGTLGFGYDHLNRLTVVQRDQQTVATYVYNAFGQRIGKITPDAGLRYQYDESSKLLIEYGGPTDKDYIWLGDLPVAVIDTNASDGTTQVNYVHADGLNTPRAIADESGQTIWTWSALGNPFGEQSPQSNGYVYNLRYPGQYFDAESGLLYNVNRYYDPTIGRYTQADPIGYRGGQASWYAYVDSNPLSGIDPLGLGTLAIGGAASGQILATASISLQLSISWDANALGDLSRWRIGGIFSITPLTVGSTGVGASAGALLTYSPTNNVRTLNGWGVDHGASGGGGLVLGYDMGNPYDPCNRTHNVFIGTGLKVTGALPGEIHTGVNWTAAGSFGL